jgi:hypothetical protein
LPELPGMPNLLDDLIEGRLGFSPATNEASELVRLARQCSALDIPGPAPAAVSRIRVRFAAVLENDQRGQLGFGPFGGLPGLPALRHRIAGLALTIAVAGGAASYATGIGPGDAVEGIVGLARSLALNLTPGNGDPVPEVGASTATPATVHPGTRTPTPLASAAEPTLPPETADPAATPEPTTGPEQNSDAAPESTQPAEAPAAATPAPSPAATTPDAPDDGDDGPDPAQPPPPESVAVPDGPIPTPDAPPPSLAPIPEPTSVPNGDGESADGDSDGEEDESRESREPDDDEDHG